MIQHSANSGFRRSTQLLVRIPRSRLLCSGCVDVSNWGYKKKKKKNVNHAANDPFRTEHSSFWLTGNKQTHTCLATRGYRRVQQWMQQKGFCEATPIMSIPPSWLMPAQQHYQHFILIYTKIHSSGDNCKLTSPSLHAKAEMKKVNKIEMCLSITSARVRILLFAERKSLQPFFRDLISHETLI